MDVMEAIFTRRSIRKYNGEPVAEEDLKRVIKAGCAAPSAHNKQPWNFVIVREKGQLEEIAKLHPYAKMLPEAGCGIIVCGDTETQGEEGFLIEDCSAAIENMLLAAHGIGLGAVWCGLYPIARLTEPLSEALGLPATVIPVGMVVLGHKAEERWPVDRYDENKIHFEKW